MNLSDYSLCVMVASVGEHYASAVYRNHEENMTSHIAKVNNKIDEMATTAKNKAEKVIDSVADAASVAAEKARKQVRAAGEKVKNVGEKMTKVGDSR